MELQFLGAVGTVTGSKTLLEAEGHRYLIDCGLYQGVKNLRERNWQDLPFSPKSINAVILTHAHIDHSGYLPALVKHGFHGPIYCTPGTRDLCNILLPDAAHLQEEDAFYANKKGFSKHHPAEPLFNQADVTKVLALLKPIPFHDTFQLNGSLKATFSPAGHIIGASCVTFDDGIRKVAFSGDVGRQNDIVMKNPEPLRDIDYLVLESTYGDRLHSSLDAMTTLAEIISKTCARGGIVLLPAFAVGRAQLALHLISQLKAENRIPNVPVYLNSPMAVKATEVFNHYSKEHRLTPDQCHAIEHNVHYVQSTEESIALAKRNGPLIIISASGMATGGRVLHHMKKVVPDHRNAMVFLGFQAPGTRGDLMVHGTEKLKIHGEYYPVKCEVFSLDSLSAHGDYAELMTWLKLTQKQPRMTFINHGEPTAADAMRMHLKDSLGWHARVPEYMERVILE